MNSRRHKLGNFRMEFKRNLGEDIPILLGERSFRVEDLYTELFRHMKARAEKMTGESIEKAYLTHPASYGKKRKHELEQSLSEEKELNAQYQKERLASIQDLILIRDKLMLRKDWLENQASEDVNAKKVVGSQLRDLAHCLNNRGVEILEADGDFDNRCQTVMETCVTDSKELLGKIAETIRPGYRFQDEILRPQEVVLYTTA